MKTLLTVILLTCAISTIAQDFKLPQKSHAPTKLYYDIRDYLSDFPIEYSFGYCYMKFTNEEYSNLDENSEIDAKYGYFVNLRYNRALPLLFEIGYSSAVFETKSSEYFAFQPNEKITVNGLKANLNFVLLPTATFFIPYIGVGYGFFSENNSKNLIEKTDSYYKRTFQNSFWKVGANINFHEIFFINGEYEQSIDFNTEDSYNQINVGVGFRLNSENVYQNNRKHIGRLPVDYSFGYSITAFNNGEYVEKNNSSNIEHEYGYYFNMRVTKILPLIFDLGVKKSVFKLDETNYFSFRNSEYFSLSAFEGGMNLTFPSRKFLMPYFGVGIGAYKMSSGASEFDQSSAVAHEESETMGFWKTGFSLNLNSSFFLNAEYKQTFEDNSQFAHNQLTAGIGFRVNSKGVFTDNVKNDFSDKGGIILTVGFHQTGFLNNTFRQYLSDGKISNAGGACINLRIASAYPFMFDLGYFSSQFKVEDIPGWPNESEKVRHRGGEVAMSLPLLSKTRYFVPYVGIGYQYSQLYTGEPVIKDSEEDYEDIVEMSTKTSSSIYKAGVMMNFNSMSYSVEFKHSLFNDDWPFYQLSANIGLRF